MGDGVRLAAEGTGAGGRLWHPSQECPGQAASARGLQLGPSGGLWEAKNGLCSPRAGLFPPSPCPAPCTLRVTGEGSPPTHTLPRAAGGGGRRGAAITDMPWG